MTIGVIWLQHAAITGALRAADATLYRLNLLVLLLVGFILPDEARVRVHR